MDPLKFGTHLASYIPPLELLHDPAHAAAYINENYIPEMRTLPSNNQLSLSSQWTFLAIVMQSEHLRDFFEWISQLCCERP